jgi:hypothetical protein
MIMTWDGNDMSLEIPPVSPGVYFLLAGGLCPLLKAASRGGDGPGIKGHDKVD